MTDAERTPEQHPEGATEQTEQAPSLLGKIMDTAKDVAGVVVDKVRDVADVVTEHAPGVVATVGDTTGKAVDKVQSLVGASAPEHTPDTTSVALHGNGQSKGDTVTVEQPATVVATVADKAGGTADSVRDTVTTAAQTVADKAGDAVTTVRKTIARIYGSATGEKGASYEPPAEAPKGGRPRRFKDVSPGMQLEGKVTSIALYGIFVDVGVGRDGLVHISEMSDKRIEAPTDLVQIGTPVTVWVKSVDPDARRISLTMRDPNRPKPERPERRPPRKPEVNREKLASLKPGDTVEGAISSLAPFGAFVDIGAGKDGLVHISELAEGRVEKPEDVVTIGQRYPFRVLEVDPEGNRISLSLRRAQRASKMQQLEPGTQLEGTISGLAAFGAFVDIGVGRDGLVHVSELSNERVNKVEDVVKVGDKVQVKILEVDPNSKRISLTMRVDEPPPAERPKPEPRGRSFGGEGTPSLGSSNFSSGPAYGGERAPSSFGNSYTPRPDMVGDSSAGRPARTRGSSRNDSREHPDRFDDRAGTSTRRGGGERGGGERVDRGGGGRSTGGGRSQGNRRDGQINEQTQEVYTFEDPEEESFTGDASLQDLLSKFNSGKGRDSRTTRDEGSEESGDRRRNDAIERTLALRDEE